MTYLSTYQTDALCGGRHQIYESRIETILTKLSVIANVVCFIDGSDKSNKKLKKRDEKYEKEMKVMNRIYKKIPLETIAAEIKSYVGHSSVSISMLKMLAKRHATLIITERENFDAELVKYANDHPSVIAILAEDSDLLIFPGLWRYFSVMNFNVDSLSTIEYSKTELRRFLGLNDMQIKILPTIAGNDIISYSEVENFQRNCPQFWKPRERYLGLARYIGKYLSGDFDELVETTYSEKCGQRYF